MYVCSTYRRPSSMPGPRKDDMLVRLALSNEDLKTSLMPKLSVNLDGGGRGEREGVESQR